jgi:hypothetical protein
MDRRTFKAQVLREVEGSVLPANSVLGETSSRRHHLVETGDAIALLELPDIRADAVDDACNVVAAVGVVVGHQFGDLPVLRVAAGYYDLDDDLAGLRLWNRDILDGSLETFSDDGFLHVWHFELCISVVLISCLKKL